MAHVCLYGLDEVNGDRNHLHAVANYTHWV